MRKAVKPRFSYRSRPDILQTRGDIRVTFIDGKDTWDQFYHNLETDTVLTGIAKLFSGELTSLDICPTSMAIGAGGDIVAPDAASIDSELLRKAVTVTRVANKTVFSVTLGQSEALGQIGSLGLLNADSGSGTDATGSLVVGGIPVINDAITVSFGGRTLPTYWVPSTSTAAIAAGLKDHLSKDDNFNGLFTCGISGSTVTVTSRGKGTAYNKTMAAQVTGGVTCAATGVTGGTTPGGTLLAAANVAFVKEPAVQILIEWSITISN